MDSMQIGTGLGLWHQGMPDTAILLEYIDKAEAWASIRSGLAIIPWVHVQKNQSAWLSLARLG